MAKRTCPACAESVQSAARVCKHCGAALPPVPKSVAGTVVKVMGGFFAVYFGVSMAWHIAENEERKPGPAAAVAPRAVEPVAVAVKPALFPARTLIDAYEKNEVAADVAYKGKRLRVSGTIRNIGKDVLDKPYLVFGAAFRSLNCYFDSEHASTIATMNKGQKVIVEGEVGGLTLGSVVLSDCAISSE